MGACRWEVLGKDFTRYWTAKEAVLKAEGTGLIALSRCRVIGERILDGFNLIIQVGKRRMSVENTIISTTDSDLSPNRTIMSAGQLCIHHKIRV